MKNKNNIVVLGQMIIFLARNVCIDSKLSGNSYLIMVKIQLIILECA